MHDAFTFDIQHLWIPTKSSVHLLLFSIPRSPHLKSLLAIALVRDWQKCWWSRSCGSLSCRWNVSLKLFEAFGSNRGTRVLCFCTDVVLHGDIPIDEAALDAWIGTELTSCWVVIWALPWDGNFEGTSPLSCDSVLNTVPFTDLQQK